MVKILNASKLKELLTIVFIKLGLPKDDAEIIADSLTLANLRGVDSHGLIRGLNFIEGIKLGDINTKPNVRIIYEDDIFTLYDGDRGIGIPVAYKATLKAIDKARKIGFGFSAVRNIWNVGMLAYYVMMIAKEGMIGISIANAKARMSIPGVHSAITGTNPIAIAIPTGNEPIVLDMALSVVALGKIVLAAKKGVNIPEGWATDKGGKITTDPKKALEGYLLPMGSYKGLGLAEVIDILCSALIGAPFGLEIKVERPYTQGGFIVSALKVDIFRDYQDFINDVSRYINTLKSLPRDSNVEILMPGEPEYRIYMQRVKDGIPIDDEVWKSFERVLNELGVKI